MWERASCLIQLAKEDEAPFPTTMTDFNYEREDGDFVSNEREAIFDFGEAAPEARLAPSEICDAADHSPNDHTPTDEDSAEAEDTGETRAIPPFPVALPVLFENIPVALRALNQWVLWRFEWNGEKFTKPPHQPNGRYAIVGVPSTWNSFEAVRAAYETGDFDGIGIVLTEGDDVVGVDLDKQAGKFGGWSALATDTLEAFDTYSERSPSGGGVRLFVLGTMKEKGHNNLSGVEIYRKARFLTVTGQHIAGTPNSVEPNQTAIDNFVARHFGEKHPPQNASPQNANPNPTNTVKGESAESESASESESIEAPRLRLAPDQILPRARAAKNGHKFRALYDFGDISDYGDDDSAADMALCRLLAFWTGGRSELIDSLFRGSALFRAQGRALKWDSVHSSEGLSYGQMTIKRALESCTGFFGDQLAPTVGDAGVEVIPGFKADDIGNGQRFAAQHQRRARYCPPWKCWLIYDVAEGRWVRDEGFVVDSLAKATARSIEREAARIEDEAKRDAMRKFAKLSTDRTRRQKMLEDARSEDGMIILPTQLDLDLFALNVLNGTIDLKTGQLRPHSPDDLISQLAPVVFDPKATCPLFEEFIGQVFGGDAAMIDCVQRALGSALAGDIIDQTTFLLYGGGANGKSTLLQTIARILGSYAHETPPETFLERKNERIATDIADLLGVRLALTSESARGQKFDEAKMKRGSGGERLTGERKFEHPFSFYPQYKLFFVTNHLPRIEGTEDAVWRRLMTVHFKARFWSREKGERGPEHLRADKGMLQKLKAEYPGILNWLVDGCLRWQKEGLLWPDEVLADLDAYREEMDELRGFIEDCCTLSPRAETPSKSLYRAYESWCLDNAKEPMSEHSFAIKLTERGHPSVKGKGANRNLRTRSGIALQGEEKEPNAFETLMGLMNGTASSGL